MEQLHPRFEYLKPEQQYEIAATIALLRLMPKLMQLEEVVDHYGAPYTPEGEPGSAPLERCFAALLRVGAKDVASFEDFVASESPRVYTRENSVLHHCLELGLVDKSGSMRENASLAFRYELQDDEVFNEIFAESDFKRLESVISEVSDYAFSEAIADNIETQKLSELLYKFKNYVTFWIGEYDRADHGITV